MVAPAESIYKDNSEAHKELRGVISQWQSGKITHESAMLRVAEIVRTLK